MDLTIQPCDWLEAAYIIEKEADYSFTKQLKKLAKYRLNASFFENLFDELSKQLLESNVDFEVNVIWSGEASIIDEVGTILQHYFSKKKYNLNFRRIKKFKISSKDSSHC